MRRLAPLAAAFALALALSASPRADAQTPDSCIKWWTEARYGALAYNHIVHIANGCTPEADCVVKTDVSPNPQDVTVPGHHEIEVMTFRGSPARTFTAQVKCVMHKD